MRRFVKRYGLILLTAVLCIAGLIQAFAVSPVVRMKSVDGVSSLNSVGTESMEDGTVRCDYILPKAAWDRPVLAVKGGNREYRVFLDGSEIYSNEYTVVQGIRIKWLPIRLPADISGKKLTIYSENDSFEVLLAEQNDMFLKGLGDNAAVLLVSMIFVVFGVSVLWVYLFSERKTQKTKSLLYLGLLIMSAGLRVFTDSNAAQLFIDRPGFIIVISFLTFMQMPYWMVKFVETILVEKYKSLRILCRLHLANMCICTLLHVCRIALFPQTIYLTHSLLIVSGILILRTCLGEIRHTENKKLKKIVWGFVLLAVLGAAAMVLFYISHNTKYAIMFSVGMLVFVLFLLIAALDALRGETIQAARLETYRQLAYTDVMTQMKNRAAFDKRVETQPYADACMVFDINNLKELNDSVGHAEGDGLIRDAAECIRLVYENIGTCYRVGGDEFAVVFDKTSEEAMLDGLLRFEKNILKKNGERKTPLEVAYGYAFYEGSRKTVKALFDEADQNMYLRKTEMKGSQVCQREARV